MATVYHIPRVILERHMPVPFGPDYNTVREYADYISVKRFGVPSLMLSLSQREVLLEETEHLLRALDEATKGRAS